MNTLVGHGGTKLEVVEEPLTTKGPTSATTATTDGNPEIKFHTEGHLLIRWGRGGGDTVLDCERQREYEHDTELLLL